MSVVEKLYDGQVVDMLNELKGIIETVYGSEAAIAIVEMANEGIATALYKHKRRGDSWIEELPLIQCVGLSKAKAARVSLLLDAVRAGSITPEEALAEFDDESLDVANYIAFARYHVAHGTSIITK